jgi:hypothetical protein
MQQPRALQRHGHRDLYVETWGFSIDRELPSPLRRFFPLQIRTDLNQEIPFGTALGMIFCVRWPGTIRKREH